jgi:hypothetical protein
MSVQYFQAAGISLEGIEHRDISQAIFGLFHKVSVTTQKEQIAEAFQYILTKLLFNFENDW